MRDYNRGVLPWAGKDSVGDNNLVGQNNGYTLHSKDKATSNLLDQIIKDQWYSQVFTLVIHSHHLSNINFQLDMKDEIKLKTFLQVSLLGPYYTQMVWADTEAIGCGFLTTKDMTFEEDKKKMAWLGGKSWVESVRVIFFKSKLKKQIY